MQTQIKTWLGVAVIVVIALTAGMFIWYAQNTQVSKPLFALWGDTTSSTGTVKQNNLTFLKEKQKLSENVSELESDSLPDYEVRNFKIEPASPKVGEAILLTFNLYNNGNTDLYGGGYSLSLCGASIVKEDVGTTCDGTKIISPRTECKVGVQISFSTPGECTISASADDQQSVLESNEENNLSTLDLEVKSTVQLTYPNGGEILKSGKKYRIKWNSEKNDSSMARLYIFDSSIEGSGSTNYISDPIQVKKKYFDWTIPPLDQLPGGGGDNYRINIVNEENGYTYDESDGSFSIVSSSEFFKLSGTVFYDENGNGYHDINEQKWISSGDYKCADQVVVKGAKVRIAYNTEDGKTTSKDFYIKICGNQSSGIYSGRGIYFSTDPYPKGLVITASMVVPRGWKSTWPDPIVHKIDGEFFLDFALAKE